MGYIVKYVGGIGAVYSIRLANAGITTTDSLLRFCGSRQGRAQVSRKTGIGETQLLTWTNRADLMRVHGIGTQFAELLEAAGVDTVRELATRDAESLAQRLAEVNAERGLVRVVPALSGVRQWIEQARTMEPAVTH